MSPVSGTHMLVRQARGSGRVGFEGILLIGALARRTRLTRLPRAQRPLGVLRRRAALLRRARAHFREADPVLALQIDRMPRFDPLAWTAELPPMDLFGVLLFQITGQQLSVPAPADPRPRAGHF